MQEAVQPVSGKLRDHHGVRQYGNESDEGNMHALVNHGFLLPLSAFRKGTKNALAAVTNLRGPETELKRQGTPSWQYRRMSHYVAEEPIIND
jgi:hypothetical protein